MKLPEVGSMILDRKTSLCYIVEVSESHTVYEDFEEWESVTISAVGYDGVWKDIDTAEFFTEGDRYANLEPLQVLEIAKHVTEQACSEKSLPIQRQLCLRAIWLLQWFSADD